MAHQSQPTARQHKTPPETLTVEHFRLHPKKRHPSLQ